MAAIVLQGKETKYQKVLLVSTGRNADLNVGFLHRPVLSKPENFRVVYTPSDWRENNRIFELKIMRVTNMYVWGDSRTRWEVEGFVIDDEFALIEGEKKRYARILLKFDTKDGYGTLYILSHDQPAPLIEVIEWCQLVDRIDRRPGDVLEIKFEGNGNLLRGKIRHAHFWNDRFEIECQTFFGPAGVENTWIQVERSHKVQFYIPREDDSPPPLAFKDGRLMFEVKNENRTTCMVYPQTEITWQQEVWRMR